MGKLTHIMLGSIIIAIGIGFLVIDSLFSYLFEFTNVSIGLGVLNFQVTGFLIIFLGAFYIVYVIYEGSKRPGKEEEGFLCTYCGDRLNSQEALREHIEKFHQGGKENVKDFSEEEEEEESQEDEYERERSYRKGGYRRRNY